MTTIRIPVQANPLDLNQDGRVTLDELVRSAFWIVAWIAIGINSFNLSFLGCAYVLLGWDNWKGAISWSVIVFFTSLGIGTIYAALLSLSRMKRYERAEQMATEEVMRRREAEDADRALRNGLQQKDGQARIEQADIDYAVFRILQEYFAGRPWARGKIADISEPRWNLANEMLQNCKLRHGNRRNLEAETLDQAWVKYLEWRASRRSHYVTTEGNLIAK